MELTDQMGARISLKDFPARIISLVPSQTEFLFDLGLDAEIVGITGHCVLPADRVVGKAVIGEIKQFDFDLIDRLKPDLIIGNKEENYREGIERLRLKYPVWMSDINTLADALAMIRSVGQAVGRMEQAGQIAADIERGMGELPGFEVVNAAFVIWPEPLMAAAADTFIDEMMKYCGFANIFADQSRYPQIDADALRSAEWILLSSDPYEFSHAEAEEFQRKYCGSKVLRVDGRMFAWYGSHLRHAPEYFRQLRLAN